MNTTQANSFVIDPVCGMEVNPDTAAATRQVGDQTFYFCSGFCAQLFDPQMTEQELGRLRAAIGDEANRPRTMLLWWVIHWARKGFQTLKKRLFGR